MFNMARKISSRFVLLAVAVAIVPSSSKAVGTVESADAVGRGSASIAAPARRIPKSNWVGVLGCIGIMTVARRHRRFLI
jgi:hypothetical protein